MGRFRGGSLGAWCSQAKILKFVVKKKKENLVGHEEVFFGQFNRNQTEEPESKGCEDCAMAGDDEEPKAAIGKQKWGDRDIRPGLEEDTRKGLPPEIWVGILCDEWKEKKEEREAKLGTCLGAQSKKGSAPFWRRGRSGRGP